MFRDADGEYGSSSFLKYSAAIGCAKLLGLRPNRLLYRSMFPIAVEVDPRNLLKSLPLKTLILGVHQKTMWA
jgi:hypothetical protein